MIKVHLVPVLALLLLSNDAVAFDVTFSWIPNTETNLDKYEVYCDPNSNVERSGPHTYWKIADKDNVVSNRVVYTWQDFPLESQYCCVVAMDSEGMVSDFSNELYVDMSSGYFGPKNFNFNGK